MSKIQQLSRQEKAWRGASSFYNSQISWHVFDVSSLPAVAKLSYQNHGNMLSCDVSDWLGETQR